MNRMKNEDVLVDDHVCGKQEKKKRDLEGHKSQLKESLLMVTIPPSNNEGNNNNTNNS